MPGITPATARRAHRPTTIDQDVASRGAERDADANLLRALGDCERQQTVDPDAREHERNHGKGADHAELRGSRRGVVVDEIGERTTFETGSAGSMRRTIARIAGASAAGASVVRTASDRGA